jgi:hypothetical protein
MFTAMLRIVVLTAAIMATGGEATAHGTRSNFAMTSPNGFGRSTFVTPGFSTFPRAAAFSRASRADRMIVIVRERPVFFRPAFDGCGRRLFVTPRPWAPCFACGRSFAGVPWTMRARSFARR